MRDLVRVPQCSYREEWTHIVENSGYWFTRSSMAFFNSRILWQTLTPIPFGFAFISSEKNDMPYMPEMPRLYSVRTFCDGQIDTIGQFQQYASRADAIRAMRSMFAEVIA